MGDNFIEVTVVSRSGAAHAVNSVYPADTPFSVLQKEIEKQFSIPVSQQRLTRDDKPLTIMSTSTFASLGIASGDLLVLENDTTPAPAPAEPTASGFTATSPPATAALSPASTSGTPKIDKADLLKSLNSALDTAPQRNNLWHNAFGTSLTDAIKYQQKREKDERELQRKAAANPEDPEVQAAIARKLDEERWSAQQSRALEEYPEMYGHITMLYVPVVINGTPLQAFVDSGAQNTIMSAACAERVGLTPYVDRRYEGTAVGVGQCKILGRVHIAEMVLGGRYLPISISVIETSNVDLLLGLDMQRRHRMCIDLEEGALRVHGVSVPFLGEHAITNKSFGSRGGGGAAADDGETKDGGEAKKENGGEADAAEGGERSSGGPMGEGEGEPGGGEGRGGGGDAVMAPSRSDSAGAGAVCAGGDAGAVAHSGATPGPSATTAPSDLPTATTPASGATVPSSSSAGANAAALLSSAFGAPSAPPSTATPAPAASSIHSPPAVGATEAASTPPRRTGEASKDTPPASQTAVTVPSSQPSSAPPTASAPGQAPTSNSSESGLTLVPPTTRTATQTAAEPAPSTPAAGGGSGGGVGGGMSEAVSTLVGMGYPEQAARLAVQQAGGDLETAFTILEAMQS